MEENSIKGKIYHYENGKDTLDGLNEEQQKKLLNEFINKRFISKNLDFFYRLWMFVRSYRTHV